MTSHRYRSRLRRVVAMVACATAALPAAISTSTIAAAPAAAKSPTADAGTLVIGGEAGCAIPDNPATPADESTDCNPWRFGSGDFYEDMRAMLTSPNNFSKTIGRFKKGNFAPIVPITSVTPATLAGLDIFVGTIPIGGGKYGPSQIAALQGFVNSGGAVVLLNNNRDFGETADWLGFTLRDRRAFYAKDIGDISHCGYPSAYNGDKAPAGSVTANLPGHAVVGGSIFGFGATGEPTVHHTVNVLTTPLPAGSESLYNIAVANQPATIALNGPRGFATPVPPATSSPAEDLVVATGASITLQPAVTTPSNVLTTVYQEVTAGGAPIGAAQASATFAGLTAGDHYYEATITRATYAGQPAPGPMTSNRIKVTAKAVPLATDPTNLVNGNGNDDRCAGSGGEVVDNNIAPASAAAVIPKGTFGGNPNAGPIVVMSDLDLLSDAYQDLYNHGATPQTYAPSNPNGRLGMNVFAWLMNQLILDAPPPPPSPPPKGDTFFGLANPVRVYNSRNATPIAKGTERAIQVRNLTVNGLNVPADATAIVANVTAIDSTIDGTGFFTVWPTGNPRPTASTHNFPKGENFANLVVVPVGTNNSISVFADNGVAAGGGSVGVLVDVIGFTRPVASGGRLRTLANPERLIDTRSGVGLSGKFAANTTREVQVRGQAGVPAGATAVVMNMTVVDPSQTGSFLTVWPSGQNQPDTSAINTIANVNRPNLVVVALPANGRVNIFNAFGTTDVLADVVGYFEPGTTGGSITGLNPARIMDTRLTDPTTQLDSNTTRLLQIRANGVPASAKTVILKVTAASPTNFGGFITVFPEGTTPPNVSNLNFNTNMTVPNIVVTAIGADGSVRIHNAIGTTHVLVDVLGYAD